MGVLFLPFYFLSLGHLPMMLGRIDYVQQFRSRAHESSIQEEKVSGEVCLTPGCVKAAANILETIDDTKDPCNNFYEFACSTFLQEAVIPDHDSHTGTSMVLQDKVNIRLCKLLESKGKVDKPEIFKSVRNMYSSCMDQDTIEKTAKDSLIKLVEELGGWPVLLGDSWSGENFDWQKLSEAAYRKGLLVDPIFFIGIHPNANNSTKRIINILPPSLGFRGLEQHELNAYFRYMADTALCLGADVDNLLNQLNATMFFEVNLAKIILNEQNQNKTRTVLKNQMSLAEANKLCPGCDWVLI